MRISSQTGLVTLLLIALWSVPASTQSFSSSNSSNLLLTATPDATPSAASAAASSTARPAAPAMRAFSTVGVGVNVSLLGIGVQAAVPLAQTVNLRGAGNFFSYNRNFTSDGTNYDASLSFRSAEALLDWFPFHGGFHLSPGALLYNGNQLKATIAVPGGNTFSLNHVSYLSDSSTPVTGTGMLSFNKASPMVLLGWGNLVPRTKHVSVLFEVGSVFSGSPKVTLNLAGDVCNTDGTNCRAISSDQTVESNVQGQQTKLENDVSFFKYYPILSLGLGFRL